LPAASRISLALDYPTGPVRLIVGIFPGGLTDVLTRLLSPRLSQRFGQQFVVEDTGAGTNLAAEAVVRAAPDGYTLLMATSTDAINATLYPNLKFNFISDTAPVASIALTPLVMVVDRSFPARTVPDFIFFAKANPGKNCGDSRRREFYPSRCGIVHDDDRSEPDYRALSLQLRARHSPRAGAVGIQSYTHDSPPDQGG
jgi:tripartite-type tricarboxylate transporter receptor subunit TctC